MKRAHSILLILLLSLICIPFVQADQTVPFLPPGNVTGNYTYQQGTDTLKINTNFPVSSQDVVYPDWLFGTMLVFIVITIYYGLYFISLDPAPWTNVIACGALVFGLGLAAAEMAPLVGYTQVYQQVLAGTPNVLYVNEVVVYTMGTWIAYACYGLAIGGGFIFMVAGFLLQMKAAGKKADETRAERIRVEEIDFREREPRGR